MGSLDGITVVEIATSFAGPFAGQILGDLGADVVKVERPGTGDDSRQWAPPYWGQAGTVFLSLNRNKSSIALDFRTPEGAAVLRRLLSRADVVLHNLRPGALARAGFGYDEVRELNPAIVYCELTGYSDRGPLAGMPAYDPLVQAYSGIVGMTGEEGRSPVRVPVALLDLSTGIWAALGVLEALRRRDRTGEGAHLQLSLLQSALSWLGPQLMGVLAGWPPPGRLGSGMPNVVPYGAFATSDGHVFISAGNEQHWQALLDVLGGDSLRRDERFSSNARRIENRSATDEAITGLTTRWTSHRLLDTLREAGVPCSPINTIDQVVDDPQVLATGMIRAVTSRDIEDLKLVNMPMTIDGSYPDRAEEPPRLGQHSTRILQDAGYCESDIADLLRRGVIATSEDEEETSYE